MATITKTEGYPLGVYKDRVTDLIVTQGGVPLANQSRGIRLFKDAANDKERYRIYKASIGWLVFHNGHRILDTEEMRRGADNPGVLIDQIKRIRELTRHKP